MNAFNTWLTDPSASHLDETGIGIGAWDNPSGEAFDNVACYPLTFRLPNELRWGAVPPVQRGGDVIGQDSFTHTDGWRLRAHMPEAGKDWYEQTNIWTIQNNQATVAVARRAAVRRAASPPSSCTASTPSCRSSCTPPSSGDTYFAGITTRFVDPENCFVARILMSPSQPASDEVELQCVLEGVVTAQKYNLGDYFAPASVYTLKVHSQGGWITVWLDGQPLLSHRCDPDDPAGTHHGMYRDLALDAGCTFDNWLAKSL